MLNTAIGAPAHIDGMTCLRVAQGASGHAVYGPYTRLDVGRYVVEFVMAADGDAAPDTVCAFLDVTTGSGQETLASVEIRRSAIGTGFTCFDLSFAIATPVPVEFRAGSTGAVGLVVAAYRRLVRLEDGEDARTAITADRFPDPAAGPAPRFFTENVARLRSLYEKGVTTRFVADDVVLTTNGLSFYARVIDDVRFVDEIFFQKIYDIELSSDMCVIDIGMNVGLVSMLFATQAAVKEVHSFEPFKPTYDRACANLSLNPGLAAKITARDFGIAGHDAEPTVTFQHEDDSGRFSIFGSDGGPAHTIKLRNAADVLGPIIARARARQRRVLAKIDCEGAEFEIFATLEAAGLLRQIAVIAIEWHRNVPDRNQRDLIAPLLAHGFVVLDRSGDGEQFFYAFNIGG